MLIKKIPDGPEGISETVTAVIALAHDPGSTREIREQALLICKQARAKTEWQKAKAIHDWIKDRVEYVKDPIYREFVQPPIYLIKQARRRSAKAAGDCFVKGTRVLRKKDHKLIPIELVQEGDYIWGYNRWSQVTRVWGDKGVLPTTLIKLNNGSSMRLTEDHKVWIAECRHKDGYKRTKSGRHKCSCKMDSRELRRIHVSELEEEMVIVQPEKISYGENSLNPGQAYIEGLYLADGWCDGNRLCISGKDGHKKQEQKEEVQEICEDLGIRTSWHHKYIRVYDKGLVEKASRMGSIAYEKHLLEIGYDEATTAALLKGILADSGKNTNGNGRTFTTTSEELWLQTRVLLKMQGIPCSEKYIIEHGGLGRNPIWRLGIRDVNRKDGKHKLFRVKEIVRDQKKLPCFDIETDDHFVWLPEADWTVSQCDDHCALNMALLGSIGISTRAVVSEDPTRPGPAGLPLWAHIFCEALVRKTPKSGRQWVPVDSSMWFLDFGKKVGGRSTTIYPGDIPADLIFDASMGGNQGLGFVSRAIALGSKHVDNAMKQRTTKGGLFNFNFSVNGLDGAAAPQQSKDGLGFVLSAGTALLSQAISTGSSLVQAAMGKRLQEKLAKRQAQATALQLEAQVRLAEQAQKLEFQSRQLDAERASLLQSEEAAFDRLRSASKKDRITAAALIGVPLAAILVLNIIRGRKKKKEE